MSGSSSTAPGTEGFSARHIALAFTAGFLGVILFHQPMLALLHALGVTGAASGASSSP